MPVNHSMREVRCKVCDKRIGYARTNETSQMDDYPIRHFSINMFWMDFLCDDCMPTYEKGD